jgi:formylglycine-generating enzyme required for sulfatase activity
VVISTQFRFPTLTEDEIAANHKQKKKMIKAMAKFDKKVFSYIPSGSFDYKGKKVSVQAFWIQQAEVTNLEYRTFLFDLIIQNKRNEFYIASPDQTQWVKILGEDVMPMQNMYFSHEEYNDYPVVNISRKGAEMYCKWLTDETNATLKEDEKINKIRIPTRVEWVKAASNEGKYLPFPWGTLVKKDGGNCYLANFDASTYPLQSQLPMDAAGDGALFTAKTRTYNPNEYELYNMSGNVAEMVHDIEYEEDDFRGILTGYGTAGGSWMNTVEEIKINGPDPYQGVETAHPAIGFRVVVTHLNIRDFKK